MTHDKLRAKIEALEKLMLDPVPVEWLLNQYRAQLAALGPEPEQPWTPRERRLRDALEKIQQHSAPCGLDRGDSVVHLMATAALADTPPPDPREEALENLVAAAEAFVAEMSVSAERELIAAICAARGTK